MWVKGQIIHNLENATGGVKDLLTRAAQPHLFDRQSWFQLLWTHNNIGFQPIIVRTWNQGARCWLFLAEQTGKRASGLANYYTLGFRPIFTGEPDQATRKALLVAIARRLRTNKIRLAHVNLSPVPQADGSAELLSAAFKRAGWIVRRSQASVNWTINVSGQSFADYWAARPGELRSTYARKLKKVGLETEIHTELTDALWAEYESVYADSWKPEEGSLAFIRALAMQEGAAGCLRLGMARHKGEAVAVQLWTVENGHAIIYKLAYRDSAADQSPGTILTAAMFRHVIDTDKVDLIDYGTGNDAYKLAWMDTCNSLERIDCYNPSSLNGLVMAARAWVSRLARSKSIA